MAFVGESPPQKGMFDAVSASGAGREATSMAAPRVRHQYQRRSHDVKVDRALYVFRDFPPQVVDNFAIDGFTIRLEVSKVLFPTDDETDTTIHYLSPQRAAEIRLKYAVPGVAEWELREVPDDSADCLV